MRKKVIILSAFLNPFRSGAEACAEEVTMRLVDRYDITIVTAKLTKELPREDMLQGKVPVRRVGFGFGFDKWLFPFLAPFAVRWCVGAPRRGAPTTDETVIIHAVLETFAGLALHFCKLLMPRAKRLLTLQTTNRKFLKGSLVRSPHAVTAISVALKDIAECLGRKDVTVIPNGIPLSQIEEACERHERVPGRILFVGRLEHMKGVDTLLSAFAQLSISNFQFPNLHLRIVGEGTERPHLERLAQELGIADRVAFVGAMPPPAVYEEFAQAEIFCGLSRSEALGNVFLEAQAAGCALVATRVGGIPEIVQDGVTGLLVPPDDIHAARGALGRLLRDATFRRLLVEKGKEHARHYDWGIIAEKYGQIYDQLL